MVQVRHLPELAIDNFNSVDDDEAVIVLHQKRIRSKPNVRMTFFLDKSTYLEQP